MKIVKEFFYDVFTNYNVQMWGMLASERLKFGPGNAMNKMATDIVYRLVLNSHHCLKTDWLPKFMSRIVNFYSPFLAYFAFLPTTAYILGNWSPEFCSFMD